MKIKVLFMTVAVATGLFFYSCKKDNDDQKVAKPVITLTELGAENSQVGYVGEDLHIEADIVAEGKINKVQIQIHPEGEHSYKSVFHGTEWEVDTTYSEFSGLKNTIFHKHIDISDSASVGHYHFHFIVTDQEGQQSLVEKELEIKSKL